MIILSEEMTMSFPWSIVILLCLIGAIILVFLGSVSLIDDNTTKSAYQFFFAGVFIFIAFVLYVTVPRNTKEVHCIFTGTVDMSEIQSKYKIVSCDDDGVFTLLEKSIEIK